MSKKFLKLLLIVFILVALSLTACTSEKKNDSMLEENQNEEEVELIEDKEISKKAESIVHKYIELLDPEEHIELNSVGVYKEKNSDSIYKVSLNLVKNMDDLESLKEFTEKHSELIERQLYKDLEYERAIFIWNNSNKDKEGNFEYIYYK